MGLLSKMFDFVTDKVGGAIEKLGEFTHINWIEDLGMDIKYCNNPFDRMKRTDVDSATIEETIDIGAECEKTRHSAEMQAEDIEDKCITQIEEKISKLKKLFPEEIEKRWDYSLSDAFKDEIKDTISSYVAANISIDNNEFKEILNIKNDAERKEKGDEFTKRILREAEQKLKTKCSNKYKAVVKKMLENVKDFLEIEQNYAQKITDEEEKLRECGDDIEVKNNLIKEKIIDAATIECIRSLTYSN